MDLLSILERGSFIHVTASLMFSTPRHIYIYGPVYYEDTQFCPRHGINTPKTVRFYNLKTPWRVERDAKLCLWKQNSMKPLKKYPY